jgi:hypothetical protein
VAENLLDYGRAFDEGGMSHVHGGAAEDVADLAIEAQGKNPQVTRAMIGLLAADLRRQATPGVVKPLLRLALWSRHEGQPETTRLVLDALLAAPQRLLKDCLDRLESTDEGVFREVSERVVAFDWVEDHLRHEIPALRAELFVEGNGHPRKSLNRTTSPSS